MNSMGFFRFLVRLIFTGISFLLCTVFVLRIFAPGTAETAFVFQFVQQFQPGLDQCIRVLLLPISWPLSVLQPHLPVSIKAWFPITLAVDFITTFASWLLKVPLIAHSKLGVSLSQHRYESLIPGTMDWRFVLALFFWSFVEAQIMARLRPIIRNRRQLESIARQQDLELLRQQSVNETERLILLQQETALFFQNMVRNVKEEFQTLPGIGSTDALTGLAQSKLFMQRVSQELEQGRLMGTCVALIMADVDDLGLINSMHSRMAGDAVLKEVGSLLAQVATPQGPALACRLEAGRFALLLSQTSPEMSQRTAEMLRHQINQLKLPDFQNVHITASFGVFAHQFTVDDVIWDAQGFLSKADAQLYKAKQSGKNQVLVEL